MQSPHASSPNGTSPQSQFGEDRAEQTSARPSLDNSAEQPFRSAASDASGMGTPRTPMNGATTPTTSGQASKAAASQRHQQPQVSMPKACFDAVTCMYRPGTVFSKLCCVDNIRLHGSAPQGDLVWMWEFACSGACQRGLGPGG